MHKLIPAFLIIFFFASCSNKEESKETNKEESTETTTENTETGKIEGSYIIGEDSVTILPFEIEVKLSEKAEKIFNEGKETIIIYIYFDGEPKENSGVELEEDGTYFVASAQREFIYGKTVKFENVRFSKNIYDNLADKNINFGINVYSGRKTSEDNLLDCEAVFDKIDKLANQKITITGKLIYGDN